MDIKAVLRRLWSYVTDQPDDSQRDRDAALIERVANAGPLFFCDGCDSSINVDAGCAEEYADFEKHAWGIRVIAEFMLKEHFGYRCADFDPNCFCCQRWKALDDLTANPFAE